MGAKIHLYHLESFNFGDEDYYDIDYFDGQIYQTAKIKGSTIMAGIMANLPSVDTIYNADGTINSDRTITGTNSNQLLFDQFRKFVFNTNPAPFGTPGFEINGGLTGPFLVVKNAVTGVTMLKVSTAGITINEQYTLPLNDGTNLQVLATDGAGNINFYDLTALEGKNNSSSQWNVTAPLTVLPTGQSANGISFFTEANKITAGTTIYDEYFLSWGRKLTLTGTNGTANINILGIDFVCIFNTNLTLTANDFVTAHQSTINALGIQVFEISGVLRFGSLTDNDLTSITITTLTGNLSGTFDATINDHITIPYLTKPYYGQRLNHTIRINFNINVGSNNVYALSLRRWFDDSQIGSEILINRNHDYTGQQYVFLTYTAGPNDPFVTGGFYFNFYNNTGQDVEIQGNAGILIQTNYESPTKF